MESGPSTLRPHLALAGAESHLRAHHLTYAIITAQKAVCWVRFTGRT